ncbi:MAG: AAA family ATPase, partial [Clostridia bacterium]|nr:AAA family ATPase [Clostridia bacterium]
MKLLSCHIENFGTLSKCDYEFKDTITSFCENNGKGKSTLAVFIKAMFFGLTKTTKRDLDDNEREKYRPWQGGAYGGYLDFQTKGRAYRIERYFGDKESDDKARLIDIASGSDAKNYDKDRLGEDLFGVDEAGYEKSTYYSQRNSADLSSDSVYTKLTSLIEEDNDMGSFLQAKKALEEKEKIYRKNKGDDIISKTEVELEKAQRNAMEAEEYERLLAEKAEQKMQLSTALAKVETELAKTKSDIGRGIKRAAYEYYIARKKDYENALLNKTLAEAEFLGKVPEDNEADEIAETLNTLTVTETSCAKLTQEIAICEQILSLINSGETEDLKKLQELDAFFKGNPPAKDEIEKVVKLYEQINTNPLLAAQNSHDKIGLKNNKTFLYATIAGILLFVAGIVLLIFEPTRAIGISLAAAGILFSSVGIALGMTRANKQNKAHQKETAESTNKRNHVYQEVLAFLAKYSLSTDNPAVAFMNIGEKANEYSRLKTKTANDRAETQKKQER